VSDIVRFDPGYVKFAGRHSVYAGLTVDIAEESLDRASALLAGVSHGVEKAVGSALKRAADAGKTVAKRAAAKEYTLSQSEFLARTENINRIQNGTTIVFGFRGYVIPLTVFSTRIDRSGRVVTHVKKSGAAEALNHAFAAQMGSHHGIYERVGTTRKPVVELFGPATPQMMYANEEIMDEVEERMVEVY